jgi:hypothetical protein
MPVWLHQKKNGTIPIGSMYGIYTNIGGILMVNVTIYSIHGSYGIWYSKSAKTVQMLHVRCYQPNIDTNS